MVATEGVEVTRVILEVGIRGVPHEVPDFMEALIEAPGLVDHGTDLAPF